MRKERVFVLQLAARRGVDPIRALRALLKHMLRRCGLRCTALKEISSPTCEPPIGD